MNIKMVPTADIIIGNRHRKDMGDLEALAQSIRQVGLINPITVTEGLELLAGERRLRAVKMLGWLEVPANVVPGDEYNVTPESELWVQLMYEANSKIRKEPTQCAVCQYSYFIARGMLVPEHLGGVITPNNLLYLCPNHRIGVRFLTELMYKHRAKGDDDFDITSEFDFDTDLHFFYEKWLQPVNLAWYKAVVDTLLEGKTDE